MLVDINGVEIKVGQTVKTQQPTGGILSPTKPKTGIVSEGTDSFGRKVLILNYTKKYRGENINCQIILNGKINEVIV